MQLVRPSDNPAHHDAIIKNGYHVLSHVWVPMRPEKRNTLLALLKANPGYWWIDVMCARVDTPLVIMGSIYRYCDTCHVMVDCSPDLIADLAKSRLAQFDHALAPLSRDASEQDILCLEIAKANLSRQKKWTSSKHQKIFTKLHNIINMFQPEFNCMQQLLDSKWFNRLWTLQEVALPTEKCFAKDLLRIIKFYVIA
ncbi:hypothetical protein K492DRAFT_28057 [Lichtheimia hyalospora FSU 10163]|nr:hypothetical protein K492DRAFT_28057 [Lichtheimia hyalospora FSU 10163]